MEIMPPTFLAEKILETQVSLLDAQVRVKRLEFLTMLAIGLSLVGVLAALIALALVLIHQ